MVSELFNGVKTYVPKTRQELMEYVFRHKSILIAVNGEKIYHATDVTRSIINRNVGYPDGMGAVWALQKRGHAEVDRIPGCELWLDIIAQYQNEKSFYLVGGTDEVIEKTIAALKTDYPGIDILGHRNGYLSDKTERAVLLADIAEKKPDVVFVAMGSPKQELLMEEMYQKHPAVYQGLGGSFDVYTGLVQRAPKWWIDHKLEGVYRTMMEPRKRIMRDVRLIPYFIKLIFNKL